MADAKMIGLENTLRRLRAIPPAVRSAAGSQLRTEVDDLVEADKRAAPVDESSKTPGAFRDSIHAYPNRERPLSYYVIADAKDDDGKFIGSNIEQGHRARDGSHVPGSPSFWPTWRARKKGMRSRIAKASRQAVKTLFPDDAEA